MKQFLLGVLSVILVQGALNFTEYYFLDRDTKENMEVYDSIHSVTFHTLEYLKLTPLVHVTSGRCKKDLWSVDRQMTSRQWFGCNAVQNTLSDLIYGE